MDLLDSTRHPAGSPLSVQSDEYAGLSRRLFVTVNHIVLVAQNFGDVADLPPDHVAAGMTLCEAAKDLGRLHEEPDSWYVRHEHFAKPAGRQLGVGVFKDDGAERSPLPGLPPAAHCPFCGRHDDITVSKTDESRLEWGKWHVVSCGVCGAQAPGAETIAEAAQHWNKRGEL